MTDDQATDEQKIDDGGPVYPGVPDFRMVRYRDDGEPEFLWRICSDDAADGMSLRDRFAIGAVANFEAWFHEDDDRAKFIGLEKWPSDIEGRIAAVAAARAKLKYIQADSMIAQRKKVT